MAREKSENRIVPKGRGNAVPTRRKKTTTGGKAVPVNQEERQLALFPETAEKPAKAGPDGKAARSRERAAMRAGPKSGHKRGRVDPATIESVSERLLEAFENVARNRGAPGPDGQTIEELREHIGDLLPELRLALLEDRYQPGNIRRKWIDKAGGGRRGLGIPDVIDRMAQEAVRLVLEPLYEPTFHSSSHGFRPGRSCQTAIAEAEKHIKDGHEWVVDIDLEKFFDQVNHQRLMSRLAERISDKRLLKLIGRMLKAKTILPDGVIVSTDEGVPQGGPLSPLLSNIVLDELDRELERRGHRFVRYADDANIYVKSERAGRRVMESVTSFIERRLRLKVNESKSGVARPEERHFLGFSLRYEPLDGSVEVLLSPRTRKRVYAKILELTPRNWGGSLDACISGINSYLRGWIGFFGICTDGAERTLNGVDAHIRRRLRAIQLKHWKRKKTIARKLMEFGVRRKTAWRTVYGGRGSLWALSHTNAVNRALCNSHWEKRGLFSLLKSWRFTQEQIAAQIQLKLIQ